MKNTWNKIKSGLQKLFAPITRTVNAALDSKEKKFFVLTIVVTIDLLLAYVIAVLNIGIWIGTFSPFAMIRAYWETEQNYPLWLYLLLTAVLLGGVYYLLYSSLTDTEDRNFNVSESNVYGNAREITTEEISQVAGISSREAAMGTILGQMDKTEQRLISTKPNANSNGNIAVFGSPGSGKSFCFVKPFIVQAIRRGESVICTDSKGEIWADTVELARMHGYTVRRIDLKNPEYSDGWDVLKELRCDDMRALIFAQTVMFNTGNPKDPHLSAEQSLLKAVCLYQERHTMIPPEEKTFYNAYAMLMQGPDELDKIFRQIKYDSSMRVAYDAYMTFFSGSPNLRGNIVSNLCDRLQVLSSMPIRKLTSTPDVDLTLPGQKPCIYYVVVSDQHSTMKFLSSLFFSFAFQDLVDYADKQLSRRLPVKVNFLMEEFANCIGYLPNLTQYLSTCRSRAIDIILILQSLGQLKDIYAENATDIILADCATHLCIGFNDKATSELFEWRAGEATVKVKTEQHQAVDAPLRMGLPHSSGDGRRHFYTSNELMKMKQGQVFIVWQRYDCKMAHTFGINRHIEYEKGRMPTILPEVHIKLSDTEARAYLRAKEEQRVEEYEAWLAAGGNPWLDYLTPVCTTSGPASGSPLPPYIPYQQLEEEALAHSAQVQKAKEEAKRLRFSNPNNTPQEPPQAIPTIVLPDNFQWSSVQSPKPSSSAPGVKNEASVNKPNPPQKPQKDPVQPAQNAPIVLDDTQGYQSSLTASLGVPSSAGRSRAKGTLYGKKRLSDIGKPGSGQ